jgi:DNA-binding NtrC family response regulator
MMDGITRVVEDERGRRLFRRRFSLEAIEGPDRGQRVVSAEALTSVGTAPSNQLVLTDPSVSRFHLRVEITPRGFLLTDLDSTNGTLVRGLRLHRGVVGAEAPTALRLGDTVLQLAPLPEEQEIPLGGAEQCGALLGRSPAMRELFRRLEATARQDVTVLIEGETGTGKELVAREICHQGRRKDGPFVIVDCGAIPATLIESELFGHARGAFTGANVEQRGAFEEADGGTLFLDEIGELELSMQPRLLRALERGEVKRLGETRHRTVNIRVVAATNRDLERMVNQGTFRADLYYRLAVAHLRVPPLRERPQDIALLVERLLPQLAAAAGSSPDPLAPETLQEMMRYPWPGNVRELRNFLERLTVYGGESEPPALRPASAEGPDGQPQEFDALPFHQAKEHCVASFERGYLARLLERCDHNVAEAARQSGIARGYLFRMLKRYQLR